MGWEKEETSREKEEEGRKTKEMRRKIEKVKGGREKIKRDKVKGSGWVCQELRKEQTEEHRRNGKGDKVNSISFSSLQEDREEV